MIVKDHFLTGESFEIKKVSKGVLTTLPKSKTHDLRRYYCSKNYHSHSSSKSVLSILYDLSSRFMVFRKIKLLSRLLKDKKKLLDFGCGRGGFLLSAKKRGFEVCGVELIPSVQKELIDKKITVYDKLESVSRRVNAITFWHSLEHINDVSQALIMSRKHLYDKGILIVALPNHDSFDSKYYKSFWAAYDVPRHRVHFNKKGLLQTVEKYGFKHLSTKPMILDSIYVSILSEKYKGTKMYYLFGFFIGLFSNLLAIFSKEYSSNIFIFKKTN